MLGRSGKPLVWVRPPHPLCSQGSRRCKKAEGMSWGSSHCLRLSQDSTLPLPEMGLLVSARLALERLELLPKTLPYPAEPGSSGNPQIQKLRNLDLLFTLSRLARSSLSGLSVPIMCGCGSPVGQSAGIQERTESCCHCSPQWGFCIHDTKWRCPHLRHSPHPAPLVSGLCVSYWGKGVREKWARRPERECR